MIRFCEKPLKTGIWERRRWPTGRDGSCARYEGEERNTGELKRQPDFTAITTNLPNKQVLGVIPMGTSMDAETPRTISLGCWDGRAAAAGPIAMCTSSDPTPDFTPPDAYCDFLVDSGLGKSCAPDIRAFWHARLKRNYPGDAGRRRMRSCAVNLADRDGLHGRLPDVKCPVLWLHGDRDEVYSVANAEEEIRLFRGSVEARMEVVEGGYHFLSASSPEVVNGKIAAFVEKWWKGA